MERRTDRLRAPFILASRTLKSWFSKSIDRSPKNEGTLPQKNQENADEWSASLHGELEKITYSSPGDQSRFPADRADPPPAKEAPRLTRAGTRHSADSLWNHFYKQAFGGSSKQNDSGQATTLPLLPFQSPRIPNISIAQGTKSVSELLDETIREVAQASEEQTAKPSNHPSAPSQALSRGFTVRQSKSFMRAKISEILDDAEKRITQLTRARNGGADFTGKKFADALGDEEKQKLAQAAEPIAQQFIQGVSEGYKLAPLRARQSVRQLYDDLLNKQSNNHSSSSAHVEQSQKSLLRAQETPAPKNIERLEKVMQRVTFGAYDKGVRKGQAHGGRR